MKLARKKLADDGTLIPAGQPIVTPSTVKGIMIAIWLGWQSRGLVENFDNFKRDLIVERNGSSRLDIFFPIDLINQLRQTAIQLSFKL